LVEGRGGVAVCDWGEIEGGERRVHSVSGLIRGGSGERGEEKVVHWRMWWVIRLEGEGGIRIRKPKSKKLLNGEGNEQGP